VVGRIDWPRAADRCALRIKGLFDHDCVTLAAGRSRIPGAATVEVRYDPHTCYREKPRERTDAARSACSTRNTSSW
jgi:hypothetical protein